MICIGSGQKCTTSRPYVICQHCGRTVPVSPKRTVKTHELPPHKRDQEILRKN